MVENVFMGSRTGPREVKVDERTKEYLDTMIAQFTVLAPSVLVWDGEVWRRWARREIDASDPSHPSVGFWYEHVTRGRLVIRLTLDVGADEYEIRVMAGGRAILDLSGVYVDQLEDIQAMIDRAEAQTRARATA